MKEERFREIKETAFEWCDRDDMVCVSTYQKKYINVIKKLEDEHPEEVKIVAVNDDGTVCARLPKRFVHVSIGERRKREMTEEQKAAVGERLKVAREKKENIGW